MLHYSQDTNHSGVERFATIVWSIWMFRNQVIHKALQPTPLMMVDFLQANLTTLSIITTSQRQERQNTLVPRPQENRLTTIIWGFTSTQPRVIIRITGTHTIKQHRTKIAIHAVRQNSPLLTYQETLLCNSKLEAIAIAAERPLIWATQQG